ncbi:MAG: AAA family ATPase [Bacteroidetes bacterium SB0662_bin_6]|nr:AAA family ATPase [Bacteroidetes bacterium SB0668_bin_1]MYE03501.1 AAA family ATPase [Bacteroidetes bacterium SB0662_bin_6]
MKDLAERLHRKHNVLDRAFQEGRLSDVQAIRRAIRTLEDELADLLFGQGPRRLEEARRSQLYRAAGSPSWFGAAHVAGTLPDDLELSEYERRSTLRQALGEFRIGPLIPEDGTPPDPILRMGRAGSLLAVREPAILSGPPGTGKSSLLLQLAAAAAAPGPGEWTEELGVTLRRGPVVIASYEESRTRLRERLAALRRPESPALAIAEMRGRPLFTSGSGDVSGPSRFWRSFWTEAGSALADGRKALGMEAGGIVILDPALSAFAADDNSAANVRAFVESAAAEAAARGAGLVIVHHPAKRAAAGEDPEFDAASGSIQWFAAARALLYLRRATEGGFTLSVAKANYHPRTALRLFRPLDDGPFCDTERRCPDCLADLEGTPPSRKRCASCARTRKHALDSENRRNRKARSASLDA